MASAAVRKEQAIDVNVELALGDVIHSGCAVFAHRARVAILVYVLLLACAASALGLVASQGEGSAVSAPLLWATIVVLLAIPFVPALFVLWRGKKHFDQASSHGHEMRYRFSPKEIFVRNEYRLARFGWEDLCEAIETKRCFLLFLSQEDYYVVPKRFLSIEADLAFLRNQLREYLGVRSRLK